MDQDEIPQVERCPRCGRLSLLTFVSSYVGWVCDDCYSDLRSKYTDYDNYDPMEVSE
jgi:hypothetical protein